MRSTDILFTRADMYSADDDRQGRGWGHWGHLGDWGCGAWGEWRGWGGWGHYERSAFGIAPGEPRR